MPTTRQQAAGYAGLGAVLFSAASSLLDVLGIPGDVDKWRSIVGPITVEGLRQLALLAGCVLLTPLLVGAVVGRLGKWRGNRRRVRRFQAQLAELLPHFSMDEIGGLRTLLSAGPSRLEHLPHSFFVRIVHSGKPPVYALKDEAAKPVREFLDRMDEKFDQNQAQRVKEALLGATRDQKTVLWCFVRPTVLEPMAMLAKRCYQSAIESLEDAGVLSVDWKSVVDQDRSNEFAVRYKRQSRSISIRPEAAQAVESSLIGRPLVRRSISISPG